MLEKMIFLTIAALFFAVVVITKSDVDYSIKNCQRLLLPVNLAFTIKNENITLLSRCCGKLL